MAEDVSRLRQRLRALAEKLQRQLSTLLSERSGLVRGTFGTRARVCGNPGCHCAQGQLHESKYLSATVGGQTLPRELVLAETRLADWRLRGQGTRRRPRIH